AARYRPWTLSEELKQRGRLAPKDCVKHGIVLATALEQLHAGGLVHRDVKPSNIIFVNGRLKLADVGLVTSTDATFISLAGTRDFVPVYGAGKPTGDLYALGMVLYLMATGNKLGDFPKSAPDLENFEESERRELTELQAVYDKACDPSPSDRQPSAQVLRDELEMLRKNESVLRLRQLEEDRQQFEAQREAMRVRRRRVIAVSLVAAAAVVVTVGGLSVYTWRLRTAHRATVAALQANQLSRMLIRHAGWSRTDWDRVQRAARSRIDRAVERQAVSTMSGLDAQILRQWPDVEATSAAFSDDGRLVISGFRDGKASLITGSTNRIELPVAGEGKVCWARDGEPLIFLAESKSNAYVLREARTGRVRRSFPLLDGEVVNEWAGPVTAVSLDGTRVACGTLGSERIVVWDVEDGRVLGEHPGTATALAFTPDGTLLALGRPDGVIQVFRLGQFQLEATLAAAAGPNPILGLAFGEDRKIPLHNPSPGKRWLLASADLGTGVVIWDLSTRIPRSFCRGSHYSAQSVAFHADGLTLASAGRMQVHFWDVMTGAELLVIDSPRSSTRGLAFDNQGTRLVAGATSQDDRAEIDLMQLEPQRGVLRLRGLSAPVRKVWFSPDSRLIGALSDQWLLAIWETETGKLRRLIEVPAAVYADNAGLAFDSSGQHLAFAAGTEGRLVDLDSGRTADTWRLQPGLGDEMQFDSEGRLLLARWEWDDAQSGLKRWNFYELRRGGDVIVRHAQLDTNYTTISLGLSAKAGCLVVLAHDRRSGLNSVRCFDLHDGRERWVQSTERTTMWDLVRLDPTGHWCAYTLTDLHPDRALLSIADGRRVAILPEGCQALSPSGREYAGADSWRLHSLDAPGVEIPFAADGDPAGDTHTYSPDGRLFAWATGTVVMVADIETVRAKLAELRAELRVGTVR
ncbi:MAG: hypothetical protein L0Z50_37180, partial [Verrucomicrobiales bacterium]|nr:hypothetical protein [Verrucomicrobiales bacterium]